MEETIMAYIAGIIDGDGSISIVKKSDKSSYNPLYYPLIQFSKSNPTMPDLLQEMFGGNRTDVQRSGKRRGEYRWKLEKNRLCLPFLEAVEPFLQVKREQAQHLRYFIENNQFVRGQRISDDQAEWREKQYINILHLNQRRPQINHKSKKMKLRHFWPYLAGLFDTDGSFSIKKERKTKHGTYSPVLSLSLISSGAINCIMMSCKYGVLSSVKAKATRQGIQYRFAVYKVDEVKTVIRNMLPYLRNKRNAARVLLHFCEHYEPQGGRYLHTDTQTQFRETCYTLLKQINDGVYKSSLMDLEALTGKAEGDRAQAGSDAGQRERLSGKTPVLGDATV